MIKGLNCNVRGVTGLCPATHTPLDRGVTMTGNGFPRYAFGKCRCRREQHAHPRDSHNDSETLDRQSQ